VAEDQTIFNRVLGALFQVRTNNLQLPAARGGFGAAFYGTANFEQGAGGKSFNLTEASTLPATD